MLRQVFSLSSLLLSCCWRLAADSQPNVVVVLTDDQGWGDLSATGNTNLSTPHIFHDNGPNGYRWNGGMKGKKGSTDEGGVRSPLFIRWPAKIRILNRW